MKALWFLEIDPVVNNDLIREMMGSVSTEKNQRLSKYRHEIDRKLSVYSEILARCLACRLTGAAFDKTAIFYGETGKPVFEYLPNCHFNISHTKYAVAAVVASQPVGVDVERVRDIDRRVAETALTGNELSWLDKAGAENWRQRFFEIWTKKEAVLKRSGEGLAGGLKTTDVTCLNTDLNISTFQFDAYVLSACTAELLTESDIYCLTEEEFIKMWRFYTLYVGN
ncbi:4'-phosphopantetheinyl transferase superfamily protein [Oscillospiraceae bacterium CM]|nr:4'-phosphopantetheinyl transferase superfamily protein [Oscillospiraceae bacterium CM]